ncbi:ferrous iron transport protein B [Porphyromonas crevioricanis]|uniref:Ferrous iron transport protein B n=1 Tax=Porphyromonas crevioricanis TaxID=393921 RepID=A0AB34PEI1_9PORP|nr:ferrous iron transport protein B [Porphyromonas crevioricanis]KGN93563.1 ferrous iron transporter B [Porphyromonas crevioricanis]
MKLSELKTGQRAVIKAVGGRGVFHKRIMEMGFIKGKEVTAVLVAPLQDPVYYKILDYNVSLRREDAKRIEVELLPTVAHQEFVESSFSITSEEEAINVSSERDAITYPYPDRQHIRVALLGNPNCGKTSLFNQASGAHEHVGNYSGVTVEAKTAHFTHRGCRIEIVDLPGTYSLSPYSPEELYIREYLTGDSRPDIILNVVDTTNLERNLYLSVQAKEIGLPIVMALNMYDEYEKSGDRLDHRQLSTLLGIPMLPTICRTSRGLEELFDCILRVYNSQESRLRPISIDYGSTLEPVIEKLSRTVAEHLGDLPVGLLPRYVAIKLVEGDSHTEDYIRKRCKKADFVIAARNFALKNVEDELSGEESPETVITDRRYGFIAGALRETYIARHKTAHTFSDRIDHWIAHKVWGFPIFLLFMFIMFEATFVLGAYPMDWIEQGVALLGDAIGNLMPDGSFKDLLLDGVIGGVGGVIVFLPNILILYFFISLMEDSGYMSRAAFIMDKLMHKMGLHGKSFIPLVMGFGCNVPAIMATRTIESPKSRMITMLVLPLMSCSARLPVYLLLAGAFFPQYAGLALFSIYLLGIVLAIFMARLFKKTLFAGEDMPFVMELPPYRLPTSRSVLIHMWEKGKQYLRKMGGVILLASIVIWFLGYFPRNDERDFSTLAQIDHVEQTLIEAEQRAVVEKKIEPIEDEVSNLSTTDESIREKAEQIVQQENSYIGRIGKWIEPVIRPLGFDWKIGVALISGAAAKEIVVSTLGVIYMGDNSEDADNRLTERLKEERNSRGELSFTPLIAISLMVFVLIYFPCIAVITAIGKESGSWRWALFSALYSCALAWLMSFIVFQLGRLFGLG